MPYLNTKLRHISLILAAFSLIFATSIAKAHCDTMDGPVVVDARAALSAGDVTPVLKWVNADDEQVIRDAFDKTLEVRALSEDAREMADRWFFETLVRVHRASEGEPYTGLKPAGSVTDKVILMADETIADGSAEQFAAKIAEHTRESVQQRYDELMELAKTKDESPEAGRAWVAAYVDYIHFSKAVADIRAWAYRARRQQSSPGTRRIEPALLNANPPSDGHPAGVFFCGQPSIRLMEQRSPAAGE